MGPDPCFLLTSSSAANSNHTTPSQTIPRAIVGSMDGSQLMLAPDSSSGQRGRAAAIGTLLPSAGIRASHSSSSFPPEVHPVRDLATLASETVVEKGSSILLWVIHFIFPREGGRGKLGWMERESPID